MLSRLLVLRRVATRACKSTIPSSRGVFGSTCTYSNKKRNNIPAKPSKATVSVRSFHTTRICRDENKDYYELLGVAKNASAEDIKAAYRKLALKYHPDRNPDPKAADMFKSISTAYSVLSNDEKRQAYDQFGAEGVDQMGGMGGMSPEDLFNQIFSQMGFGGDMFGGMGGRQRGPMRTPDLEYPVELSLDEFYTGKNIEFTLPKEKLCDTCHGSGAKDPKAVKTCKSCNGNGFRVVTQRMGPMIQQSQEVCRSCHGQGKTVAPTDRCPTCNGNKVIKERKKFSLFVEPGRDLSEHIVLHGEAHQAPGAVAGDIVVTLHQKAHPRIQRHGHDLIVEQKLSLAEALGGFQFNLPHLNKRVLNVSSNEKGNIVKPGDVKKIPNEGMPIRQQPGKRGDLYIKFDVDFPEGQFLDKTKIQAMSEALGPKAEAKEETKPDEKSEVIPVTLVDVNPNSFKNKREGKQQRKRSAQGEPVQCAQM
jgi:DnaJ family protein A protein 2